MHGKTKCMGVCVSTSVNDTETLAVLCFVIHPSHAGITGICIVGSDLIYACLLKLECVLFIAIPVYTQV